SPEWPPKKPVSFIALNKGRLRKCIFSHLLLGLLMIAKLVPDILDRLDIFVLEIEELEVPQPLKWEYVWLAGTLGCFLGLIAVRKNRVMLLQIYFGFINMFSTVPILFALMLYFSDFWEFCTEPDPKDIQVWQGYPLAALWYAFLIIAMQVHIFTLIFAWKLIAAWKGKAQTRKAH
ncbi:UNVERIFIED_CONTAM: hypothetical protein GTU68_020583, partial [Idotea baltica]|nr:hypothetical protein [Idotea baltica]